MSQIPPPPPSQPGPMGAPGAASNKKIFTVLAYLFTWVGGIIFLFVGKDDPDVKWNASQSIIIFGGLAIVSFVLGFIPFLGLLIHAVAFIAGLIFWILFLIQSLQGNGERIPAPVIGPMIAPYVEQLANSVH